MYLRLFTTYKLIRQNQYHLSGYGVFAIAAAAAVSAPQDLLCAAVNAPSRLGDGDGHHPGEEPGPHSTCSAGSPCCWASPATGTKTTPPPERADADDYVHHVIGQQRQLQRSTSSPVASRRLAGA